MSIFRIVLGIFVNQYNTLFFMSLLNVDALSFTGAYLFSWCSSVGTVQMGKLCGLETADITDYVLDRSLPRRSAEIRPTNSGVTDLGQLVWADTP